MYSYSYSINKNDVIQWAKERVATRIETTQERINELELTLKDAKNRLLKHEADKMKLLSITQD